MIKFTQVGISDHGHVVDRTFVPDNDLHLTHNAIRAEMQSKNVGESMCEIATYLDSYFDKHIHGPTSYENTIKATAHGIAKTITKNYDLLKYTIAPEVEKLTAIVNERAQQKYRTITGCGTNPIQQRFLFLDLQDLSKTYGTSARIIAEELCTKYNIRTNTLNAQSILYLVDALPKIQTVHVDDAVLENIVITITNDTASTEIDTENSTETKPSVTVNGEKIQIDTDDKSSDEPSAASSTTKDADDGDTNETPSVSSTASSENSVSSHSSSSTENIASTSDEDADEREKKEKKQTLQLMLRSLTDQKHFNELKKIFRDKSYASTITPNTLTAALRILETPVTKIEKTITATDLSHPTRTVLRKNLAALQDLQKCAHLLVDFGAAKYENALIIGQRLVNKTVFDIAVARGFSNICAYINDHLRNYHNHNKDDIIYTYCGKADVPVTGIALDTVLALRPVVESNIIQTTKDSKNKLQNIRANLISEAFSATMRAYTEDVIYKHPELVKTSPNRLRADAIKTISHYATTLKQNKDANIEDTIYRCYIDTWCRGTMVDTLYTTMQVCAHQELNAASTTENLKEIVTVSVIADIASKYLCNTLTK